MLFPSLPSLSLPTSSTSSSLESKHLADLMNRSNHDTPSTHQKTTSPHFSTLATVMRPTHLIRPLSTCSIKCRQQDLFLLRSIQYLHPKREINENSLAPAPAPSDSPQHLGTDAPFRLTRPLLPLLKFQCKNPHLTALSCLQLNTLLDFGAEAEQI